jgi:hypothetical protein
MENIFAKVGTNLHSLQDYKYCQSGKRDRRRARRKWKEK